MSLYNFSKKLPKFLRLPTPVELGKSKYEVLPLYSKIFNPNQNYSWKDYENDMKKMYPIKYWIYYDFYLFISSIFNKIDNFLYWIKSHTYRKYHLLDLRNKENNYKYGWLDCDNQLLFAIFAIVESFIKEKGCENHIKYGREELNKLEKLEKKDIDFQYNYNYWIDEIRFCEELLEMQKWWRIERPKAHELSFSNDKYGEKYEIELDKKDEEMMKRVIEIRAKFWT